MIVVCFAAQLLQDAEDWGEPGVFHRKDEVVVVLAFKDLGDNFQVHLESVLFSIRLNQDLF